jgi:hypothetical protein
MVDILSKKVDVDREYSRTPGEVGGFERPEREAFSLERKTEELPVGLSGERMAQEVVRIEAGQAPTVPEKMLEQAVEEAKASDTLVSGQTAARLEQLLNNPKSFREFLEKHGPKDVTDAAMDIAGNIENKD